MIKYVRKTIGFGIALVSFMSLNAQFSSDLNDVSLGLRRPSSVVCADIDGDGDQDVVSCDELENIVVWFENDGEGVFIKEHFITNEVLEPRKLECVDIDNDGDQDIFVGEPSIQGSTQYHILYQFNNLGGGEFANEATDILTGEESIEYIFSDINGDSYLDLVSISNNSYPDRDLNAYMNDGNGSLNEFVLLAANLGLARTLGSLDVDQDLDSDLILGIATPSLIITLINDGAGSFSLGNEINSGVSNLTKIQLADINQDSLIDIAALYYDYAILWFENLGNDQFGSANFVASINGWNPEFEVVDVDGDGDLDFGTINAIDYGVTWIENLGDLEFSSQIELHNLDLGQPKDLTSADLDSNGRTELIACSHSNTDHKIIYHEWDDEGNPSTGKLISPSSGKAIWIESLDMDEDGDSDILASGINGYSTIAWYENDGSGQFIQCRYIQEYLGDIGGYNCEHFYSTDDSLPNIIACQEFTNEIFLYRNNGIGEGFTRLLISDEIDTPFVPMCFDADNDGDEDLFIQGRNGSLDAIFKFENNGVDEFENPEILIEGLNGSNSELSYNYNDVDYDGDIDFVISNQNLEGFFCLLNDGMGNFTNSIMLNDELLEPKFIFCDIDNDDKDEILALYYYEGQLVWYDHDDGYIPHEILNNEDVLHNVPIIDVDYDEDGDLDLILKQSENAVLLINDGNGNFEFGELPAEFQFNFNATALPITFDVTGDGLDEIVWALRHKVVYYLHITIGPNCTDPIACNYNPEAIEDDGSCEYITCIDCTGDTNFDGEVNVLDILLIFENYGCMNVGCPGDVNGDGNTNVLDLVDLSNNYELECE